jgi:hypothetical protein
MSPNDWVLVQIGWTLVGIAVAAAAFVEWTDRRYERHRRREAESKQ